MTIPTIEYRGYVLRAYSQKLFPTYHDPYAGGPKKFSSVVSIDTIPSSGISGRRYATPSAAVCPANSSDAIDLAMQYGKSIIDGRVHATSL
jgi:hypothetical protein